MVGESRSELLLWLNATLGLNYNRVEQCGSGAAYCQIMDSIHGGVPMGKIKFNASNEYDYRHNLKILQSVFTKHRIAKTVEVERLVKCRLQDNLELLQWMKKYWRENKDTTVPYDGPARRRVTSGPSGSVTSRAPLRTAVGHLNASRPRVVSAAAGGYGAASPGSGRTTPIFSGTSDHRQPEFEAAVEELKEYKILVTSLQAERNFYFNKLREIEVLCEQTGTDDSTVPVVELVGQIQAILYRTEEGFQAEAADEF